MHLQTSRKRNAYMSGIAVSHACAVSPPAAGAAGAGKTPEVVPGAPGWNPNLASDSEAAVSDFTNIVWP